MLLAAEAKILLLDASVFFRFCDGQLLPELIGHLRHNAQVVPEVEGELRRNAQRDRFAGLRLLERTGQGWPPTTAMLPSERRTEFERIRRAFQQPGEPTTAHIGEIATALMAEYLKADLVVMDDRDGTRLLRKKGIARLSTAQVAVEMVHDKALTYAEGLVVFNFASDNAGEQAYQSRLREHSLTRR